MRKTIILTVLLTVAVIFNGCGSEEKSGNENGSNNIKPASISKAQKEIFDLTVENDTDYGYYEYSVDDKIKSIKVSLNEVANGKLHEIGSSSIHTEEAHKDKLYVSYNDERGFFKSSTGGEMTKIDPMGINGANEGQLSTTTWLSDVENIKYDEDINLAVFVLEKKSKANSTSSLEILQNPLLAKDAEKVRFITVRFSTEEDE